MRLSITDAVAGYDHRVSPPATLTVTVSGAAPEVVPFARLASGKFPPIVVDWQPSVEWN